MIKANKLVNKNFLSSFDISSKEVHNILELAKNLKNKDFNIKREGKVLGLIFDKYCWLIAFNSANKTLLYRLDLIRDVFKSNTLFAKPNKNYVKEWWQKKYGIKKGEKNFSPFSNNT